MTRRLFVAFLLLATGVLLLHDLLRSGETVTAERRGAVIALERQAFRLALYAQDDLEAATPGHLFNPSAHRLARRAGAIAGITDTDGNLIELHPHGTPEPLRRLTAREANGALRSGDTRARTVSHSGVDYEAVAVPVVANRGTIGAVAILKRSAVIERSDRDRLGFVTWTFLVAVLVSAIGAWVLARWLTRPLEALVVATRRMARQGSGAPRVEPSGTRETRELAEAFNAMSLRVRDLVDRQRSFASDVSHQLRTPVTTIGLALDHADARLASDDRDGARDRLVLARAELDRLHHLVEGLLVLTRVSLSDAPRTGVAVDVVVHERVATWSALAAEHGVELVASTDGPCRALAVPDALEQVVDNLVDNALAVAPPDSAVTVAVRRRGDAVVLTVRDHGPGMTTEERARAFERFWRGEYADDDGLGLGLTIVHDLVVACGGAVGLQAPADGGLLVVVTLHAAGGPGDDAGPDGRSSGGNGLPAVALEYLRARDPVRATAVAVALADGAPRAPSGAAGDTVEAFRAVRRALDPIDPAADAVLLEQVGGLDAGRVAAVLGVSRRQARSWLRRGHRRTRRRDATVAAGALALGFAIAGAGTAAATGMLPPPIQHGLARTLSDFGVSVPDPATTTAGSHEAPSPRHPGPAPGGRGDASTGTGSTDAPPLATDPGPPAVGAAGAARDAVGGGAARGSSAGAATGSTGGGRNATATGASAGGPRATPPGPAGAPGHGPGADAATPNAGARSGANPRVPARG